jgi:hypothetical protein
MLQQKCFNVQQHSTLEGRIGLLQEGRDTAPTTPQEATL